MTTLEQAVRDRILAVPLVAELVAPRAYPDRRPQSTSAYPTLEIETSNLDRLLVLDGDDGTRDGTVTLRFYGETVAECESLAISVRDAIAAESALWSGLPVDACLPSIERDSWYGLGDGLSAGLYAIEVDYRVLFRPA